MLPCGACEGIEVITPSSILLIGFWVWLKIVIINWCHHTRITSWSWHIPPSVGHTTQRRRSGDHVVDMTSIRHLSSPSEVISSANAVVDGTRARACDDCRERKQQQTNRKRYSNYFDLMNVIFWTIGKLVYSELFLYLYHQWLEKL